MSQWWQRWWQRFAEDLSNTNFAGAFWFGAVIGWVTSVSFHSQSEHHVKDIAAVIGAVGGAAVTRLFPEQQGAFPNYCIGLAVGFAANIVCAISLWRGKPWPL